MSTPYRVSANKRLGQHFLSNEDIISRIVDVINPMDALAEGQKLLEIGPGLGAITLPLLKQAKTLTAIELDHRVIPILQAQAKPLGQLNLIESDVLCIDYPQLLGNETWRVFGNLPYNISTPILFRLIAQPQIDEMIFMLQKEVVERMTATPGNKNYGRLSVMLSYYHEIYPLFDVPPESFSPAPKVMSAMVGLKRLSQPRWHIDDSVLFTNLVKQAFTMRRKTLRNNLKSLITGETIEALGINPNQRAECLGGQDFAIMTNYLSQRRTDHANP